MCYWVQIILFVIDEDVSHVLLGNKKDVPYPITHEIHPYP